MNDNNSYELVENANISGERGYKGYISVYKVMPDKTYKHVYHEAGIVYQGNFQDAMQDAARLTELYKQANPTQQITIKRGHVA